MKKIILLLSFYSIAILSYSQKITYNDLIKLSTKPYSVAVEHLIDKGFIMTYSSKSQESFEYKIGSEEIIVKFMTYDNINSMSLTFSQKFDKDYKAIETYIKNNLKKLRFFYNEDIGIYTSEYKFGHQYVYLYRGMTTTTKSGFKHGELTISEKRNKPTL